MNRPHSTGLFQRLSSPRWRRFVTGALLATAIQGCSRQFWRRQADMDVYDAEAQKLVDRRWAVPRVDVTADPRSRFFDPYDLDKMPLPPDDPWAHQYMHCVDGWQGYKGWHVFGDTMTVENPQWLAPFGLSPSMIDPATGQYTGQLPQLKDLTLTQAVELSQIHSREYQTQIENMYLAALAVTFQRFQFGVRYLTTVNNPLSEPAAGLALIKSPDGNSHNDSAAGSTSFGISQLLPSGAQYVVELTNNTIWLFGGGNQTNTASLLSFQLTQPLWFNAGRKVVLELLTQAERNLLYTARTLARFRQQLFTDVVATSQNTSYLGLLSAYQQILNQAENLRRLQYQVYKLSSNDRGKVISSAFLPAIQEVDKDGKPLRDPNTREVLPPRAPEYLRNIPESLSGFLSYDIDDQRLRWRRETPMTAEQALAIRAISDQPEYQLAASDLIRQVRDPIASLDVLQILTQYTNGQNTLRNQERTFQNNLDAYKVTLGLPPTIPVTLDERLLKQFELIDKELLRLESEADQGFSLTWSSAAGEPDPNVPDDDIYDVAKVRAVAAQFQQLVAEVRSEVIGRVRGEIEAVTALVPKRLQDPVLLPDDKSRLQIDFDRDRRVFDFEYKNFLLIEEEAKSYVDLLARPRIENSVLGETRRKIKDSQEVLIRFIRTMSVIQVGLRTEMIQVNPFEWLQDEEKCITTALANRFDLMNARGAVMDARRQVEIAANRLQSALSLTGQANFANNGITQPFNFERSHSQYRFGVQFRAPLDQITERNNYRATLIDYQQARRDYMLAEDTVKLQVRLALRGMTVQRQNLETGRGAIRRAAMTYDAQNEQTDDPARVNAAAASTSGNTGLQVLQALNAILQAQNNLITSWVDYERNRLNIYRDMGIMDIGPDGIWNDPYYRDTLNGSRLQDSSPTTLPTPPNPRLAPGTDGSGAGGGVDASRVDVPVLP